MLEVKAPVSIESVRSKRDCHSWLPPHVTLGFTAEAVTVPKSRLPKTITFDAVVVTSDIAYLRPDRESVSSLESSVKDKSMDPSRSGFHLTLAYDKRELTKTAKREAVSATNLPITLRTGKVIHLIKESGSDWKELS